MGRRTSVGWRALLVAVAVASAFGAVASGCTPTATPGGSSGTEGRPTTMSGAVTPTETTGHPLVGGEKVPIAIFFSTEATGTKDGQQVAGERLVAVTRMVPSGTWLIADAAELWLKGPTPAESARGLTLAAPKGLKVRSVKLEDGGVLAVDLPKAVEPGGGSAATMNTLGQLVYTMTAAPGVRAVRIKIDGRPVARFGGEGFDTSKPLTRTDLEDYFMP